MPAALLAFWTAASFIAVPPAQFLPAKSAEAQASKIAEATQLNRQAVTLFQKGDYANAIPLAERALDLYRQTLGERHTDYAANLNNLAVLYHHQGLFPKAEPLFEQSLRIWKELLGEDHPRIAANLNNLAMLYLDRGAFAKAEPLLRESLRISKKSFGERHPSYAATLSNLATVYRDQGAFAKAEPLLQQALQIRKEVLGERHPSYASSLHNLATLFDDQGAIARAEPLYVQALQIRKETLGERHPAYAETLNNLALLYQGQGDFARAEPLYEQALRIRQDTLGESHPEYAGTLSNLAGLYRAQGLRSKAEPLLQKALRIRKESLGDRHPDYAFSLNNLAVFFDDQGATAKAAPLYRQAAEIVATHLNEAAPGQSEQTQLDHLRSQRRYLSNFLIATANDGGDPVAAYASVLSWKGAVTVRQRLARFARIALATADAKTRHLYAELQDVGRRLATLAHGPRPQAADYESLFQRREALEVELARRVDEFGRFRRSSRIAPADLQAALPARSALIDFFSYGREGKEQLVAFVITHDQVRRVPLGPLPTLTETIDEFLASLERRRRPAQGDDDPAVRLGRALWQPLVPHLDGAEHVLISPDGPLCRLPFGAMPTGDGKRYLLEERAIAVVPVPQLLPALLASRGAAAGLTSLLAVGDVDFDAGSGPPRTDAKWSPLPGTRDEVLAIGRLFTAHVPGGTVAVLRGERVGEVAFGADAPRHTFLHVATHGFFAPPHLKSALRLAPDAERTRSEGPGRRPAEYDPGLLSGMVFTGANRPSAQDDGILTALEVAEMDLSKVQLAVLSACETGLGETAGGEGVLGLQRAFQVAGARATVTSLWKVDDQATRDLMGRFYDNLWNQKRGTLQSLREAQLWLLNGKGAETPFSTDSRVSPRLWAAFVLGGDWR